MGFILNFVSPLPQNIYCSGLPWERKACCMFGSELGVRLDLASDLCVHFTLSDFC